MDAPQGPDAAMDAPQGPCCPGSLILPCTRRSRPAFAFSDSAAFAVWLEKQMPTEDVSVTSTGVRAGVKQEEQLPDKPYIAALQKIITDQQEAYTLLYQRNLRLYDELMEANQTIQCLSTPSNQTAPRAS